MNLRVAIDGNIVEIELTRNGEACDFRVSSGAGEKSTRAASLVRVAPGVYSVLLNGKSYDVRVEPGYEHAVVAVQGQRFAVEVQDPRRSRGKTGSLFGEGKQHIVAPMPGKVVRVLVALGSQVAAGQGLVVVEAMKMQNEMKAPKAGRVTVLSVQDGDAVSAGQVLATIE